MKLKKLVIAILLVAIIVAQFSGFAFATGESLDIVMKAKDVTTNLTELHRNDEFSVLVRMENFKNIGKGVMTMGATLSYDNSVLELKSIKGENRWTQSYNASSKKLVLVREKDEDINAPADSVYVKEASDVMTMTFKVKADAVEPSNDTITLSAITVSGGNGVIRVNDSKLPITVVKVPEKPKSIESTEYLINNTDKDITKIVPNTTVAQFKQKIIANNIEDSELVFTKGTTVLTNNSVLTTGTILTVTNTDIRYTIIVKGDIDGEIDTQGRVITENDLAKIKLHFIEAENAAITGSPLKAADYDLDGKITVNDIAIIKLIILGVPDIKV